jgi:5-methylcytosine-specific restriction endonuclease McrA
MPYKNKEDKARNDKKYNAQPKQIENRVKRNLARRIKEREGSVRKGDGKEVDHKVPLSKGGGSLKENLRVVSRKANRKKYNKVNVTICVSCHCDPCECGKKGKKKSE